MCTWLLGRFTVALGMGVPCLHPYGPLHLLHMCLSGLKSGRNDGRLGLVFSGNTATLGDVWGLLPLFLPFLGTAFWGMKKLKP